jgi:hypothetical protein
MVSIDVSQFWGTVAPERAGVFAGVSEGDWDLAAGWDWIETGCDLVSARDLVAALGWARSLGVVPDLESDFEGTGVPAAFWLVRDFDVLSLGDFAMETLLFDTARPDASLTRRRASCRTMISGSFGFRQFPMTRLAMPPFLPEREWSHTG